MVYIHSVNKYLVSPYYMMIITLDPEKTDINQLNEANGISNWMGGERQNKFLLSGGAKSWVRGLGVGAEGCIWGELT